MLTYLYKGDGEAVRYRRTNNLRRYVAVNCRRFRLMVSYQHGININFHGLSSGMSSPHIPRGAQGRVTESASFGRGWRSSVPTNGHATNMVATNILWVFVEGVLSQAHKGCSSF